jgi:non-homologous end joining protein Ku
VDADTGEEVSNQDIMKGYKVDTDTYIEVSKDELDNIALESTRTTASASHGNMHWHPLSDDWFH